MAGAPVSSGPLSSGLERFIRENIHSIEQLEILLLLLKSAGREWSPQEIGQHLYRQPDSVAARLEELRQRGLVNSSSSKSTLYCYNSATPQDANVRALDRAFQERKDTIIRIIFEAPKDHLRLFSDAFRIRRQD